MTTAAQILRKCFSWRELLVMLVRGCCFGGGSGELQWFFCFAQNTWWWTHRSRVSSSGQFYFSHFLFSFCIRFFHDAIKHLQKCVICITYCLNYFLFPKLFSSLHRLHADALLCIDYFQASVLISPLTHFHLHLTSSLSPTLSAAPSLFSAVWNFPSTASTAVQRLEVKPWRRGRRGQCEQGSTTSSASASVENFRRDAKTVASQRRRPERSLDDAGHFTGRG